MSQAHARHMSRFVELVRRRASPTAAAAELRDLPLAYHALAYAVGVVMLRDRAPAAWRQEAKRLLFASERPYFR